MSEEQALQSEEVSEVIENESIETLETSKEGADLAPVEPEKIVYSDAQQENINQMFGKKTKQLRDTERERDDHLKTIEELQSKIPAPAAPVIPPIPSIEDYDYDEVEFNRAMASRDDLIGQAARYENQKIFDDQRSLQNEQNALMESQRQQQEASVKLVERAGKNGITQDDIQKAAVVVGQYRMNDGIVSALLNDNDGDVMIMHLANNPIEADNLSRMNPFEAARMLDTSIREKAQKYKISSSKAPKPSQDVLGKGGGEVIDSIIAGVTFT